MHTVLIGNTGSGKSTVAKALEAELGLPRISSGDIARRIVEMDPAQGMALKAGLPGPEAAMRLHVREALEHADATSGGWILEGFPYYVEQLICIRQWTGATPTFIHLDITEWNVIERLLGRGRPDDTPEAIAKKFERFRQHTVPMLHVLRDGHVLHDIDVNGKPPDYVEMVCMRIAQGGT